MILHSHASPTGVSDSWGCVELGWGKRIPWVRWAITSWCIRLGKQIEIICIEYKHYFILAWTQLYCKKECNIHRQVINTKSSQSFHFLSNTSEDQILNTYIWPDRLQGPAQFLSAWTPLQGLKPLPFSQLLSLRTASQRVLPCSIFSHFNWIFQTIKNLMENRVMGFQPFTCYWLYELLPEVVSKIKHYRHSKWKSAKLILIILKELLITIIGLNHLFCDLKVL